MEFSSSARKPSQLYNCINNPEYLSRPKLTYLSAFKYLSDATSLIQERSPIEEKKRPDEDTMLARPVGMKRARLKRSM